MAAPFWSFTEARGEVGEVHPLDGLLDVRRRAGDVEAVEVGHHLELLERANLLGELLAVADVLLGHDHGRGGLLGLLVPDEEVDAVEGNAAVVADDAAAAVAVGKTGDDVRRAAGAHLGRVDVEDAGVMGLAAVGVGLHHVGVDLVAVLGGRLHRDADTAVDVQGALEWLVGLKAHDGLALGVRRVDVARRVRHDARDRLGVHVEHAALLALLGEQRHDVRPEVGRALGGAGEEGLVALVGGVVALDEVADVHLVRPRAGREALPRLLHRICHVLNHAPCVWQPVRCKRIGPLAAGPAVESASPRRMCVPSHSFRSSSGIYSRALAYHRDPAPQGRVRRLSEVHRLPIAN